ncbi:MAG: CBS domain-containing protein [Acidobacteriota bacterium]|nr:CBS domain-containing protein [Acidobacteriota bacterium]
MGEQTIKHGSDSAELREFTRKLLADLHALERMLADNVIESGVTRLGAEQELALVDEDWRPAMVNLEVLERIDDPHFTTELGKFNIEFNLDPVDLASGCLRQMEDEIERYIGVARQSAARSGASVVLTGILPTLDKSDLTLDNMTPVPRYFQLNEAMTRLRGRNYDFRIKGRDELLIEHDNVMLEACNTSFQIHFQVAPERFATRYNIAQAVAAPVLAAATNSPLLFGRSLWRETRIALFQQSIDTRAPSAHLRDMSPRVSFGRAWVAESALEIFQEDLARFKVIMSTDVDEDPLSCLQEGRAPELRALRLHNGTVYRWNRPCYGVSKGKPHLRIENRVLPAGPTVLDEMANAAFWFGLMSGVGDSYEDITRVMEFEQARENFVRAARLGLGAQFHWPGQPQLPAQKLILDVLAPLARQGLKSLGIDEADIDRYLAVIEGRVDSFQTGAKWIIRSYDELRQKCTRSKSLATLVAASMQRESTGEPVHTWSLATPADAGDQRKHYLRIDQIMTTDLFTVNRDELVDMAAYVMNWQHIRHVPVEDEEHRLVGLVSHRALLRLVSETLEGQATTAKPVSEIMNTNVITVRPETPTLEAIRLMRIHRISCLPVVDSANRLAGIVTEHDFMEIARQLLEDFLRED